MSKDYYASTQKELLDKDRSVFAKYSNLFLGRKSFFVFLKYELIIGCFSWVPGAFGFMLRKWFYPRLLKKVGKGVVFGRNITLRHPHKIAIGANTVVDDNVVLDAKGEANTGIQIGQNAFIGRNSIISCKEGSN